ncbi:MAG: alginate lyase family protein [Prolixibacteraceae bacterium]
MKKTLIITLCLLWSVLLHGQLPWQSVTTPEEACAAWAARMNTIFQQLDLSKEGLQGVKAAYESGDLAGACRLLLRYYDSRPASHSKEHPPVSEQTIASADSILNDCFTFQRVAGRVPRRDDGHLDWSFEGPENDIEWAWALNRHYPVNTLLAAYFKTGNPAYARYIDQFVKDWIIRSWPYPAKKSSTAMWRGLEVSFRVKMWAQVFYDFAGTGFISPATRLLILSSLPDHAHYARNFHAQNNWLTMEMSGLATLATAWPEFRESKSWLDYTITAMTESMKGQVYPDGVQTELSSAYHRVALSNFSLFHRICKGAGISLPPYFTQTIEDMWHYLACTMRPDGHGILNNDSDLDSNRDAILKMAEEYGRPDWQYVASNGKAGEKPAKGPSFFFPWAGQLVSRSGYDEDAHWSFFDIGPWGSGHQHSDKLHLSVSAYGRDLLVDAGRFAYRGEVAKKFRSYATGSQGHNVLLIDGNGQAPGDPVTKEPVPEKDCLILPQNDLARGSFDRFNQLEGGCKHTRTLAYQRGDFWIVVDQIATDRPRKIEALWHWHPACDVSAEGKTVFTQNKRGNLQIIPLGRHEWELKQIKGQETPAIQGWYSRVYNQFEPNTVSVYTTQIEGNSTFAWVLFPSEAARPGVTAQLITETPTELKIKVTEKNNKSWFIAIPLSPQGKTLTN